MICMQVCARGEWRSLKKILGNTEVEIKTYPFGEYIRCMIKDKECIFFHSGATKTRSSAACQYAIDNWEAEIIIVLGTCGGVDTRLKTLDVVIADKTAQYDCIDRMGNEPYVFYEEFVTSIDNSWINLNEFKERIWQGTIATADQDVNYEVMKMLQKEQVLCADWESGAIAYICRLNQVRCCIVRGITDIPVEEVQKSAISQGTDYRSNTPKVMEKLIEEILPILIRCLG